MNTTKLTERDFSLLKKYCGNGIETRWRGILKRLNGGERIRVVNTGVVSSGKSSILNALTDHVDEERFPTGAARTTTIADEYEYGDNILFVDTPGIDVTAADDATAFDQRHSKIEMIEEEVSREVAQMRMTGQTKLNVFRRLCSTYQDLCAELRQL